jgi:hypothetical protein
MNALKDLYPDWLLLLAHEATHFKAGAVKYTDWQNLHTGTEKERFQEPKSSLQGHQNLCGMEDRAQHRVSY